VEFDPFNVGVTQMGRQKAHEIMAAHAGWPVVLALVVSTSLSGRLTRLRMADIISDLPKITSRTFFKRTAALEWLLQHRADQPKAEVVRPVPKAEVVRPVVASPLVSPILPAPVVAAVSAPAQPEAIALQSEVQIKPKAVP